MTISLGIFLSGVATIAAVVVLFLQGLRVGMLRDRLGIPAPAVTGDPQFERAFRVHMNTLEQFALLLPLIWISTLFLRGWPWIPAALTAVWIVGRIVYARAYMADPAKRSLGFQVGGIALVGLSIASLVGLVQAALALMH